MTTLTQQTQDAALDYAKIQTQFHGTFMGNELSFKAGVEYEQNRDRWIKVEDGMPEEDRERPGYSIGVWATDGEMQFTCRYYFPAGKWIAAFKKVTHWQPLPQPPKA